MKLKVQYLMTSAAILLLAGCRDVPLPVEPTLLRASDPLNSIITTVVRQEIPTLGGSWVRATDMNASGVIAGLSETVAGETHAFIWDGNQIWDLGPATHGPAINNLGHVAFGNVRALRFFDGTGVRTIDGAALARGSAFNPDFGTRLSLNDEDKIAGSSEIFGHGIMAFMWDGSFHEFVPHSEAVAINSGGQVAVTFGFAPLHNPVTAFLWDGVSSSREVGFRMAVALNDAGQVAGVGTFGINCTDGAFLSESVVHQIVGPDQTCPDGKTIVLDMNNAGQVVGYTLDVNAQSLAFVWDGELRLIGNLGPFVETVASGLNDAGQIVGRGLIANVPHAFFWDGTTMHDLGATSATANLKVNDAGYVMDSQTRWRVIQRPATPTEEIQLTLTALANLEGAGQVSHGQANSLRSKLEAVARQVEKGNSNAAKNVLRAFINEVQNLVSRGALPAEDGQALIDTAQAAIDKL